MPFRTSDGDRCPVCGESYDRRVLIARGDGWDDLYPGSPLEFFRKFGRRCSADYDAEADASVGGDEVAVYFHGGGDRAEVF